MNFKRSAALICFYAIGFIAVLAVFRYIGLHLFHFSGTFGSVLHSIIFYTAILCTLFCATAYATGRKNSVYSILLAVFFILIVVFVVVL